MTAIGGTVGDVLDSEGITLGEHDVVAPGLDEEVTDGSRITVRFGRPLDLSVDGAEQTYWVTSTKVADALGEITALTVEEALAELKVKVQKEDRTRPGLGHQLTDGDRIVFTDFRVVDKRVAREPLDFGTVRQNDSSLLEGRSTVSRSGARGVRDVTYRLVFRNGELINEFANATDLTSSRPGDPPASQRQFSAGYVGLQNHGGPDLLQYRDVRVEDLSADAPARHPTGAFRVSGLGPHSWASPCRPCERERQP